MATVYSDSSSSYRRTDAATGNSYSYTFKTWLTYSTSTANDKVTISASMGATVTPGSPTLAGQNYSATLACTGQTTKGAISSHAGTLINTQTWPINRTKSSQTITITASVVGSPWGQTLSKSHTITVPTKPSYTITYDANGGSGAPASQTKWYGETLTISSTKPTKAGYYFVRWVSSGRTDGTVYFQPGNTTNYNGAQKLVAEWAANKFTISYNANGGTQTSSAASQYPIGTTTSVKTYNNNQNLFDIGTFGLSKAGYHVNSGSEWNKKADGTGTSYNQSTDYSWSTFGSTTSANTSVTLYANWKPDIYTIVYNKNAPSGSISSGSTASSTHSYGVSKALTANGFSVTGYTFNGWNTNASGTGTNYSNKANITTQFNPGNGGTVNLYAKWAKNTYTITYNYNGGTAPTSANSTGYIYKASETTTVTTSDEAHIPHRKNYKFLGWRKTSTTDTPQKAYVIAAETTGNIILEAVWESCYIPPVITKITSLRTLLNNNILVSDDEGTLPKITIRWIPGLDSYLPSKLSNSGDELVVNPTGYTLQAINKTTGSVQQKTGVLTNSDIIYYTQQNNIIYNSSNGKVGTTTANEVVSFWYIDNNNTQHTIPREQVWVEYTFNPIGNVTNKSGTTLNPDQFNLGSTYNYTIAITLTIDDAGVADWDGVQSSITKNDFISEAYFIIDINGDGTAIGFGAAAFDNGGGIYNKMDVTFAENIYLMIDYDNGDTASADYMIKTALTTLGWSVT